MVIGYLVQNSVQTFALPLLLLITAAAAAAASTGTTTRSNTKSLGVTILEAVAFER